MTAFKPYANEEDSIAMDELTIENRLDRISIYGSIQLTKDKAGLEYARQLKGLLDATVASLEAANLPEHVAVAPTEKVTNPFRE